MKGDEASYLECKEYGLVEVMFSVVARYNMTYGKNAFSDGIVFI